MARSIIEMIHRRSDLSHGFVAERSADVSIAERGFNRMGLLLAKLGDPHRAYRTIHVAGSKGKGSTTHIASALLTSLGIKTGRYTSPHLLEWNERIAVNDLAIRDADFARVLAETETAMQIIETRQPELGTYNAFELLTAAAFLHFREEECDLAVIEVGLGGRFDSTNHVHPLVSVITRIEEEHVDILGPSIRDIAWNKAGIIKPNTPVVVADQFAAVDEVIRAEADSVAAPLLRENHEWQARRALDAITVRIRSEHRLLHCQSLPGEHNLSNVGAALTAVDLAVGGVALADDQISETLAALRIPGRFERRIDPRSGQLLVLDVAHTPESVAALIDAAVSALGMRKFPFIVGLLSDKPATEILARIAPVAEHVIFPQLANPRAVNPRELQAIADRLNLSSTIAPSILAALAQIPDGSAPLLVTGSFGIVAECQRVLSSRRTFDT
jgi:dihydrofolate synthase / folylpolyglutamate synthase